MIRHVPAHVQSSDVSITAPIPIGVTPDDLSPGDYRYADFDWTGFNVSFIDSPRHPRFDAGYAALWDEFGASHEMEQRAIIEQRLGWRPEQTIGKWAMRYEMVVVLHDNELAAVCDHSAIADLEHVHTPVTVHLSHLLILPRFRGSGLAGWMRAMPIRTARECLERSRQPARPINLVCEMEPADAAQPARVRRLATFGKAGFLKIDPGAVNYLQPDFRPVERIDATAPQPLPLSLVVRRVNRESELTLPGHEVRAIVTALYRMYSLTFRAQDMQPNWDSLASYPNDHAQVALIPPPRE